jgi:hypothetical protein
VRTVDPFVASVYAIVGVFAIAALAGYALEGYCLATHRYARLAVTAMCIRTAGLLVWTGINLAFRNSDSWTPLIATILGGTVCITLIGVAFVPDAALLSRIRDDRRHRQ